MLFIRVEEKRRNSGCLCRPHFSHGERHVGSLETVKVVQLENVPTRLFLESQDHQHDLIRELQLIDIGERGSEGHERPSQRLAELIAAILARYGEVRAVTRRQALRAMELGERELTLEIPVQEGMREALQDWLELLEEADRLAVGGELLLIPAREEIRQLRRWYVSETVARIRLS